MGTLSTAKGTVIGRNIGSNGYEDLYQRALNMQTYFGQIKSGSEMYKALLAEINKYWIGDDADEFKGLLLNISKNADEAYQLAQKAVRTLVADKTAYDTLQTNNKAIIGK